MCAFHRRCFPFRSGGTIQVDDVGLLCLLPPLPEEEDQCGDGHEPSNTSNNATSDGADVSLGPALLFTALVGCCQSWRTVGGRGGSSSFWIPSDRLCKRGIESVLFLIQRVQMLEIMLNVRLFTHRVIEISPVRYRSIRWDADGVPEQRSDEFHAWNVRSNGTYCVT